MTQQIINVGAAPNDGTGDPAYTAFDKCNDNFTELYARGGGTVTAPQGRLTLGGLTAPVMLVTYSSITGIEYVPYVGDQVPIYNGTTWTMTVLPGGPPGSLSCTLSDTTKNPAAVGASQVVDWFIWSDAGTLRLSHGPAWISDTARSAGTAIERINGLWVNSVAITNACAAQRGTYVGTTRSNASSTLDWVYGGLAAGGTAGFFGLWNCYNRVEVASITGETTDSWTYATAGYRPVNGSSAMRCSFVRGLNEDPATAEYGGQALSGSAFFSVGIGLNSTTAMTGLPGTGAGGSLYTSAYAKYSALPGIGFYFLQALEHSNGGTATFFGDNGNPGTFQNGLLVRIKA